MPLGADAQSFDCRKAKYPDERAICNNSQLAEFDVQMSNEFYRLHIIDIIPPNATGIVYLGETQGQWIFVQYERSTGWVDRNFVMPVTSRGEHF